MSKSRLLPIVTCLLGAALLISTSDWFGDSADEDPPSQTSALSSAPPAAHEITPTSTNPGHQTAPGDNSTESRPALSLGDRFSLQKTVEQRVTQESQDQTLASSTRLTIRLDLEVEDMIQTPSGARDFDALRNQGDTKFRVHYRRVKFTQDLPGEVVVYDSQHHSQKVPPQAAVYHGLTGQGFSFWVDRKNRLSELDGFSEFLRASLQEVPPHQRTAVWKTLAGTSDADHLADFVDDSIALLPIPSLERGMSWHRERKIRHPVPVDLKYQYTLEEVTDRNVEVAVGGSVLPQTAAEVGSVKLLIRGGRISGRYAIDRQTGVPTSGRVEQVLEMTVQMPGGSEFGQTKQTITSITSLPNSASESPLPIVERDRPTRLR